MRLLILLLMISACPSVLAADSDNRPNIVFAFADDWGRHASAYAVTDGEGTVNDAVRTPNFDQIASQGVLFNNAFVNAPSCTPCRSSLLSGQYFWRTGRAAILQGAIWDSDIPSWPLLLRDSGYHIGYSYKVWSPGSPRDAPYGGDETRYQTAGRAINGFSQFVTKRVNDGASVEASKQVLLDQVRDNFREFLEQRNGSRPFAFWFGPTNVHRKWIKGSGKALWGIDPDQLQGKMPPFLPDVPDVRQDLADYLGEVQAFDAALGVLLAELKARGELQRTIVVVSGDHGAPGFPHGKCNLYDFGTRVPLAIMGPGVKGGRVVDDLVSLPDLAPTFLEAGEVTPPSVMTARTLWPVLSSEQQGRVDIERAQVFIGRERHVARARAGHLPYPQRAIRTDRYLLVINFRPDRFPLGDPYRLDSDDPPTVDEMTHDTFCTLPDEDAGPTKAWLVAHRNDPQWHNLYVHAYGKRPRVELFDLDKDPYQMKNVAHEASYAEVVEGLTQRLMDELKASGDPRLENRGEFFETPPMAGPLPSS